MLVEFQIEMPIRVWIEMSIAGQSRVLNDTQLPMCLLHMIQNILSPHAMEQSPVTLMKTLKIISFLTTVKSVIHLPLNEAEMKIIIICLPISKSITKIIKIYIALGTKIREICMDFEPCFKVCDVLLCLP